MQRLKSYTPRRGHGQNIHRGCRGGAARIGWESRRRPRLPLREMAEGRFALGRLGPRCRVQVDCVHHVSRRFTGQRVGNLK